MHSREAFEQLKLDLTRKYREVYPHFQGELSDFRQKDIANFQAMLTEQVQGRVSEKWFYTHLKGKGHEKLPRIDILDMLSRFVGQPSWEVYCSTMQPKAATISSLKRLPRLRWIIPLLLVVIGWSWATMEQPETLQLQFIDALRQAPIQETAIQVTVQQIGHPEQLFFTDKNGYLPLSAIEQPLTIRTQATYFLPDTFLINPQTDTLFLALKSDDYALMIHYFSTANIEDWKHRREQLNQIFAEDAVIFQLNPAGTLGMDMLNKEEFINKLTIPINSLRNVKVWSTIYEAGRIKELRFSTP